MENIDSYQQSLAPALGEVKAHRLKKQIGELKALCDEIDPYGEISEEEFQELGKYGVLKSDDPFTITNKLILSLEDSIEKLAKLEEKNLNEKKQH